MTIPLGDRYWLALQPDACVYCGVAPDGDGQIDHLIQCRIVHARAIAEKSSYHPKGDWRRPA